MSMKEKERERERERERGERKGERESNLRKTHPVRPTVHRLKTCQSTSLDCFFTKRLGNDCHGTTLLPLLRGRKRRSLRHVNCGISISVSKKEINAKARTFLYTFRLSAKQTFSYNCSARPFTHSAKRVSGKPYRWNSLARARLRLSKSNSS